MGTSARADERDAGSTWPWSEADAGRTLALAIEAARIRVDETSLRQTAQEIGMSPTGLRGVLDGAEPYGRTRERLRAWFARLEGLGELPLREAENTVLALVRRLPEPRTGAVAVLDCVAELHARAGMSAPEWVAEVRLRVTAHAPQQR